MRDLISLSASIFFVSSLPRCVAKSLELTVQEGIHTNIGEIKINWSLGFRRENVYSSDSFGLSWFRHEIALTKTVNRSTWFWFCSEIALKKPTSNQNDEPESCKWSNREVRKNIHRGVGSRLHFPLPRLLVLAPFSSAISCDYFASDSRSVGDLWLETIGKSEISRISDEKIDSPSKNRSDSCLKSVSVGSILLDYSQWTYKDEILWNIEIPLAKCNREIRSIENLAPRIGGSRYWQNVWIT